MSLRSKPSRSGHRMSAGGFSNMSMGSYSIPKISPGVVPMKAVTVNKSLLTPMNITIDPTIHAVRNHEKEQIQSLNDKFASFIDKVRFLEQQNKMLETKWKLMQEQAKTSSKVEPMLKSYIASLQQQLETFNHDKYRLDMENSSMHRKVDDCKTLYESEINNRNDAENDFVYFKKDADTSFKSKMDLEEKVSCISKESEFYKTLYDMEFCELQESMKETSVLLLIDNSRSLNMEKTMSGVKAQYEDIAARSREEAENLYRNKFDRMTTEADQYDNELRSSKAEITELNRIISRLQNEMQAVKANHAHLEAQITEADLHGERVVQDARVRIKELEKALKGAKQDMTRQIKEYQDLMNVKLALDIEISTYEKLLEGEEERLGNVSTVNIRTVTTKAGFVFNSQQQQRKREISNKTAETREEKC